MKRFWIGLGLLVLIWVAGLWTASRLEDTHSTITRQLEQSADAAQAGHWFRADALAEDAFRMWQEGWDLSAALADHTVLDEIDGLLAQADVYRNNREPVSYAAICARISQAIDALQESHRLTLRNLL